jgi:uncharacterized membrane protein YqiK
MFALHAPLAAANLGEFLESLPLFAQVVVGLGCVAFLVLLAAWLTLRHIPNQQAGVVEKLWSLAGPVPEGGMIALHGEAGYQADLLRGGIHFGLWRWQYRVHKIPLVTIPQGKIGYVYARDGEPLAPSQTLGRVVECNNFQDGSLFLGESNAETKAVRGQRGRQRAILREGVYAINPALFVVMTEDAVYYLRHLLGAKESAVVVGWQEQLSDVDGFRPLVVGAPVETVDPLHPESKISVDSIAIVTVHDGPSLEAGEIIAPAVGTAGGKGASHNNYQDPEAFLAEGGRRGRQYLPLTDGTYFLNHWFVSTEIIPKTVVPIGYVGVVVSYYGRLGKDVSGDAFRHGERVSEGERGVWERPLGPGKYPFNSYAGNVILVPTTNFVLHWITGRSESHRYDESLRSIDLVTKDAYEPMLPLSVVVHIDYQKAPSVIQRFGDVKKLITQTLDPMLSAFFRDVAHKKTMLELLHLRDAIQAEAREELRRKFREFDIECVDVLIGKPGTAEAGGKIEVLLEQLRLRQLSIEQLETYERQRAAAERLRTLNDAQAQATMQTQLTNSRVQIQIAESQGEAELARARKQADQTIVNAEAELARSRRQAEQLVVGADAELARSRRQAEQTVVTAHAESQQRMLAGRGEAQRIMQVGLSESAVLMRKIASFGDPRLYALSGVAEHLAHSTQPLVPERVFVAGAGNDGANTGGGPGGMLGLLVSLLVAEKGGVLPVDLPDADGLKAFGERLTREALDALQNAPAAAANGVEKAKAS